MPKVSVIIPTYNRGPFVVRAVDSVLAQDFPDREIIVVDDGSTDDTSALLARYQSQILYLHQANAGVSAARNRGISAATGEWLAFLDSDDEWTSGYLTKQIQRTGQTPEVVMQTADCTFFGLDGRAQSYFEMNGVAAEFAGQQYLTRSEPFSFVLQHAPWQVGSTIIRSDALQKAGPFDTSLKISEDLDLVARMSLQGPFGLIRESLVNIYRRSENLECLTLQARNHPWAARESDERLYHKLARIKTLKSPQRKTLNTLLSANRRAMGNLMWEAGQVAEARHCYQRAFSLDYSLKSLGKYVLSWTNWNRTRFQ